MYWRHSLLRRNNSTSWSKILSYSTMYWYWRLQSIIAQAAARSLFQSGLLEESTSLEPDLSIFCSSSALLLSVRREYALLHSRAESSARVHIALFLYWCPREPHYNYKLLHYGFNAARVGRIMTVHN
jgi:hypothetical protein